MPRSAWEVDINVDFIDRRTKLPAHHAQVTADVGHRAMGAITVVSHGDDDEIDAQPTFSDAPFLLSLRSTGGAVSGHAHSLPGDPVQNRVRQARLGRVCIDTDRAGQDCLALEDQPIVEDAQVVGPERVAG